MLDCKGYGKVCDMGLARFVVGKTNTQVRCRCRKHLSKWT